MPGLQSGVDRAVKNLWNVVTVLLLMGLRSTTVFFPLIIQHLAFSSTNKNSCYVALNFIVSRYSPDQQL
jgi:hypothetical protein